MTISFVKKVCELLELEQDRSISVQSKTTTNIAIGSISVVSLTND